MLDMNYSTTYCCNIYPLSSLDDFIHLLKITQPQIAKVLNKDPFKMGLWAPNFLLDELMKEKNIELCKNLMREHNLDVITFNGFPYSKFHGETVKEKVYLPDWSQKERLMYLKKVSQFAHALDSKTTVISTLSGGFLPDDSIEKKNTYIENMLEWVQWASYYEKETGFIAKVALEPEPYNTLQSSKDIISLWSDLKEEAAKLNIEASTLNKYLGICLDVCHFSVIYENPTYVYKTLKQNHIPVHKFQLSISPKWTPENKISLEQFFGLDEPVYLHQSFASTENKVESFLDLHLAKQANLKGAKEWRTHFHIPLFLSEQSHTTGADLIELLNYLKEEQSECILEVETYSFSALKDLYNIDLTVEESIIRELQWLENHLKN